MADDNELRIAVMGLTGSGKTSFINLACDSETKLRVGHGLESCTGTVDEAPSFKLDGRRVRLFDTPGFDDSNKPETEILRIIGFELEKQYRQDERLHGVIYVHRISDPRVSGSTKANFDIFKKLCGDKSFKNVIIVTNMWSRVTEEEANFRTEHLESNLFKEIMEKGAHIMHNNHNTVKSAHEIMRAVMKNHPLPLVIQEELVEDGRDINETAAGQAVDERIAALMAEYERKLKEVEEARRTADEETRKEQEAEKAKNEEKLANLQKENATHAAKYRALQDRLDAIEEEQRKAAAKPAAESSTTPQASRWPVKNRSRRVAARFQNHQGPGSLHPGHPEAVANVRNRGPQYPPGHPLSAANRGTPRYIAGMGYNPGNTGGFVDGYYRRY